MYLLYRDCDEPGLKKYINDYSRQLAVVKNQLKKWSFNKCWYCEGRSDIFHLRVDHFRPKNELTLIKNKDPYKEARTFDTSPGYWWLAFDWKNFRLTGEIVNSYKGSFFPLQTTSSVASQPNHNYKQEQYLLLDPTIKTDSELIIFNIDGLPTPSVLETVDPLGYFRADLSIKLFGLKDSVLIDSRKIVLRNCHKLIERAEKYWLSWNNDQENAILQEHFSDVCTDLISMTKVDQPFSKMVISRIKLIPDQWAIDYVFPLLK